MSLASLTDNKEETMSGFYQYDTRGASEASQIITYERLLAQADQHRDELLTENEKLRTLLREVHDAIYNEPNDGQLDRLGERIDAALKKP